MQSDCHGHINMTGYFSNPDQTQIRQTHTYNIQSAVTVNERPLRCSPTNVNTIAIDSWITSWMPVVPTAATVAFILQLHKSEQAVMMGCTYTGNIHSSGYDVYLQHPLFNTIRGPLLDVIPCSLLSFSVGISPVTVQERKRKKLIVSQHQASWF